MNFLQHQLLTQQLLFRTNMRCFAWQPKQKRFQNWKIVRGDNVEVISGKYKGHKGKVLEVKRKFNTVIVQGANLKYKTVKDEEYVQRTKTVYKEYPIHVSNVGLVDPTTDKVTKIEFGYLEDGTKVRVAKKTGAIIEKPNRDDCLYINRTKKKENGPFDTPAEDALDKNYRGEDFIRVQKEFDEYIRLKEEKEGYLWF